MTMIVVDTQADHASIMTDSLAYDDGGRHLEVIKAPKVAVLEGIDAAVASRGSVALGFFWKRAARAVVAEVEDFDEFTDRTEATLQCAVEMFNAHPGMQGRDPYGMFGIHAYMVGYSPRAGRFKSYVCSTVGGIGALVDISDAFHVVPAPPGVRPTDVERQVYEAKAEREGKASALPTDGTVPQAPTSPGAWVELAKAIHRGRSVRTTEDISDDPLQVRVGGPVHLTRLAHGQATQEIIHTFDSDDLYAMTKYSFHPLGQLGPCPCGSDRRFVDCHITLWQELPCHCGSGDTLEHCCKLDLDSVEACEAFDTYPDLVRVGRRYEPARASKAGRNEPCPCGSGAKYKKCCALVAA